MLPCHRCEIQSTTCLGNEPPRTDSASRPSDDAGAITVSAARFAALADP
jgi:hypothetical protein